MSLVSRLQHHLRTNPALGRLALRALPDIGWQVSISPVGKFDIRLRRHRGWWLRSPLYNDGFMLCALKRLVKPGDVVFDIGANIGLYSRFLVQRFGAAKVYAFEPMASNLPLLRRNIELGGISGKVVVVEMAVGGEDGDVTFQVDDLTSNSGTLDAVTHGEACQSRRQYKLPPLGETVRVARLDTLIADGTVPVPASIKMDIEGAEAMALDGARNLLTQHGPSIVIELHGCKVAVESLKVLWACGYSCFGYLLMKDRTRRYQKLTEADLPRIDEQYSLHFVVASPREAELTAPIADPEWPDYMG